MLKPDVAIKNVPSHFFLPQKYYLLSKVEERVSHHAAVLGW